MPTSDGRFKGAFISRVPWHEGSPSLNRECDCETCSECMDCPEPCEQCCNTQDFLDRQPKGV